MSEEGSYRVLLVEDDVALLECLALLLADEFVVHTCRSGQEALALLGQHTFQVVCSDFHMPGMDGLELFQAASAHSGEHVPRFVLVTGNVQGVWERVPDGDRATLSVLRKPCSPARIIDEIKRLALLAGSTPAPARRQVATGGAAD